MTKATGKWCPLIKKIVLNISVPGTHILWDKILTLKSRDHWSCAVPWMPMLMIENSQQQRSTSSAVESFRNEMVKANDSNQQMLDAVGNMYLDMCEAQGVNVSEYIEQIEGIDNTEENLLPESDEEQQ